MVQRFVSFMVDAGYDGDEIHDGDFGDVDPVRAALHEDAMVRAALTFGLLPNVCGHHSCSPSADKGSTYVHISQRNTVSTPSVLEPGTKVSAIILLFSTTTPA